MRVPIAPRSAQGPLAATGYASYSGLKEEHDYSWHPDVLALFTTPAGEAYFPEKAAAAQLRFAGGRPEEIPTDPDKLRRLTRTRPFTTEEKANLDRRLTTDLFDGKTFHDSDYSETRRGKVLLPVPPEVSSTQFSFKLPEHLKKKKLESRSGPYGQNKDEVAEVNLMEKMAPSMQKNFIRSLLVQNENWRYMSNLRHGLRNLLNKLLRGGPSSDETKAIIAEFIDAETIAELSIDEITEGQFHKQEMNLLCKTGESVPTQNAEVLSLHLRNEVISGWARATKKLVPDMPDIAPTVTFKAIPDEDVLMAAATKKAAAEIAKLETGENGRRGETPWPPGGSRGRKKRFTSEYTAQQYQPYPSTSGQDQGRGGRNGSDRGRGTGRRGGRSDRGRGRGRKW